MQMTETRAPAQVPTRLKVLDACLSHLEDANEQGVAVLSDRLVMQLARHVGGLRAGMLVQDAVGLVFEQQRRLLQGSRLDGGYRRSAPNRPPLIHSATAGADDSERELEATGDRQKESQPRILNEQEARDLTNRIKTDLKSVCLLVEAAHDGHAWVPLGYGTWEAYVRAEFGLSRSRSYELITQGTVVRTIQAAAGMSGVPDISSRAAMKIRSRLSEVEDAVRNAVSTGVTEEEAANLVASIIETHQKAFRPASGERPLLVGASNAARSGSIQVTRRAEPQETWIDNDRFSLGDVVEYLANLPPVPELLSRIVGHDTGQFAQLDRAARWLAELAAAWSREELSITDRAMDSGGILLGS
jgi:hypothetical protein